MTPDSIRALDRYPGVLAALVIGGLTVLAWFNRFIQDDAFISFRYARNLSEGLGLTWNAGERVEGYTNFLWTVLMAIPFQLGIDPVVFSTAVGLVLYPVSLFLTYRIAHVVVGSSWGALYAVVLLGGNYTFSAFATGGLETQLHVLLLLSATTIALGLGSDRVTRPGVAVSLSMVSAAALMTRMDSAAYLTVVYGYIAIDVISSRRQDRPGIVRLALLSIAPGAACVLAWLGWKLSYYGDIVPNTYYAKVIPFSDSWYVGLRFIWKFVESYWLLPVIMLCGLLALRMGRSWDRRAGLLACLVAVWCAYVVRVGGDFIEFRLLVPALPAAFAWLSWALFRSGRMPWLTAGVGILVIAGSVSHARTFEWIHGIEPVRVLQRHIDAPARSWALTGKVLGELFGGLAERPRIATTASGAVPYYSALPAVDMLGLMDPWVARHGLKADPKLSSPGHLRLTTFAHLVDLDVNLVVGAPWVTERTPAKTPRFGSSGLIGFGLPTPRPDKVPSEAKMKVLEITLNEGYRVYVLYLMPHDGIDRVIEEREIPVHPVSIVRASTRRTRP